MLRTDLCRGAAPLHRTTAAAASVKPQATKPQNTGACTLHLVDDNVEPRLVFVALRGRWVRGVTFGVYGLGIFCMMVLWY